MKIIPDNAEILDMSSEDADELRAAKTRIESLLAWEKMRADSGVPLPNSCVFLFNKLSILEDELITLKNGMAQTLQLPAKYITVKLAKNERGHLVPSISVDPPNEWIIGMGKILPPVGKTVREMAQTYAKAAIAHAYEIMKQRISRRCEYLQTRRVFLDPETLVNHEQTA
jgi:hypothetical protein